MNSHDDRRKDDESLHEAFELTPPERKAFEMLPRDRIPNAALEDRVVGALRDRGLLTGDADRIPPRRRMIELTARRIATAVAAALVLMVFGFALGQWTGRRQVARAGLTAPEAGVTSVAAALQQAGSAYVTALQQFAELPDSINGNQAVQGREVALMTLYTAAGQVTRLVPKYELTRQLLAAIDAYPKARTAEVRGYDVPVGTTVIEF